MNMRDALSAVADATVREITDLEFAALGDSCLPSQLRPIVLAAMSRASTLIVSGGDVNESNLTPAERHAHHLSEVRR